MRKQNKMAAMSLEEAMVEVWQSMDMQRTTDNVKALVQLAMNLDV